MPWPGLMGADGQAQKGASLVSTKTSGGLHPGPIPCAREAVPGAGFWKRTVQAAGGQQPPQSPAKAGLQVRNPACVETSWATRQDRSRMDKCVSRRGPCDGCPLQQDLESQSAPLTGCKTPQKWLLSSWSAAARAAEPRPAAEPLLPPVTSLAMHRMKTVQGEAPCETASQPSPSAPHSCSPPGPTP